MSWDKTITVVISEFPEEFNRHFYVRRPGEHYDWSPLGNPHFLRALEEAGVDPQTVLKAVDVSRPFVGTMRVLRHYGKYTHLIDTVGRLFRLFGAEVLELMGWSDHGVLTAIWKFAKRSTTIGLLLENPDPTEEEISSTPTLSGLIAEPIPYEPTGLPTDERPYPERVIREWAEGIAREMRSLQRL